MARFGSGTFYEFNRAENHLSDWTPFLLDPKVKLDHRTAELPTDTYRKWLS